MFTGQSEDERDKSRLCTFCGGSGRCANCEGDGTRFVRRGWPRRPKPVPCRVCDGAGTCQLCHGTGRLEERDD